MAGIPIHTMSPINPNAAKATAVSPSTLASNSTSTTSAPSPSPAPTTTNSSYPSARPGAVPGPAPTSTAQPLGTYPTPTAPPETSRTSYMPPAPQPGAVPSPFGAQASPSTRAVQPSIPPPPKAGQVPQPATYSLPPSSDPRQTSIVPPQMATVISTPIRAIPPAKTTTTPAYNDLSHPPGYIQNSRASFEDRPEMASSPYQNQSYGKDSSSRGGLLGSGNGSTEESPIAQIWNTATSWAKTAGEKLKEGEEEVWRRITNEK